MSDSDMVEVETLLDGVVVDHRPRRKGERLAVSRAARERLGGLVRERPLMKIKANVSCLVGRHCFAVGEEGVVLPAFELAALARYVAHQLEVTNVAELDFTLPPRRRVAPPPGPAADRPVLARKLQAPDAGRPFVTTEAKLKLMEEDLHATGIRGGPVRIKSRRDDNYVGPDRPPLRLDQIADLEAALALDMHREGLVELADPAAPLSPAEPASPARKSRA